MSKSFRKWQLPAQIGHWTFELDDRRHPTEVVVRHSEVMVARLPCRGLNDQLIDELAFQTALSRGPAAKLVTRMARKCESPWMNWAIAS